MTFFQNIQKRNFDLAIYVVLMLAYGLGWDYVIDRKLELWSVVGVFSYTGFMLLFLVRTRSNFKAAPPTEAYPRTKLDLIGKIALGVVLYALLMYKLLQSSL